jgi:hypothetical protein
MLNAVHVGIRTWCVGVVLERGAGHRGWAGCEHVDAVRTVIQREAQHGGRPEQTACMRA